MPARVAKRNLAANKAGRSQSTTASKQSHCSNPPVSPHRTRRTRTTRQSLNDELRAVRDAHVADVPQTVRAEHVAGNIAMELDRSGHPAQDVWPPHESRWIVQWYTIYRGKDIWADSEMYRSHDRETFARMSAKSEQKMTERAERGGYQARLVRRRAVIEAGRDGSEDLTIPIDAEDPSEFERVVRITTQLHRDKYRVFATVREEWVRSEDADPMPPRASSIEVLVGPVPSHVSTNNAEPDRALPCSVVDAFRRVHENLCSFQRDLQLRYLCTDPSCINHDVQYHVGCYVCDEKHYALKVTHIYDWALDISIGNGTISSVPLRIMEDLFTDDDASDPSDDISPPAPTAPPMYPHYPGPWCFAPYPCPSYPPHQQPAAATILPLQQPHAQSDMSSQQPTPPATARPCKEILENRKYIKDYVRWLKKQKIHKDLWIELMDVDDTLMKDCWNLAMLEELDDAKLARIVPETGVRWVLKRRLNEYFEVLSARCEQQNEIQSQNTSGVV